MRSAIREGTPFPDYELPDQSGERRSLSQLQGGNPMVLHLSRGGFDPKEHQFVRQLVGVYPEFRNVYTRLALISTDNQLNINEFRDAVGATWPFLSDPDRVIQKDLDIKEFTDEPHDPMIPHTFVLEPGLKIFKIYNGYWYWGRPTMAELHVDLRALFQKIRPDFDLAAPGLREAWNAEIAIGSSSTRSNRLFATPRETASASNADHRGEGRVSNMTTAISAPEASDRPSCVSLLPAARRSGSRVPTRSRRERWPRQSAERRSLRRRALPLRSAPWRPISSSPRATGHPSPRFVLRVRGRAGERRSRST